MKPSLFVVALPRTFSTQVYEYAGRALGLAAPSWVLDGEILNIDRYAHYRGTSFDENSKFTVPEQNARLVAQLHEYLDQTANPQGWIYKDVTQPFVMQSWAGLSKFRVLKIERDLCDVAYAMLKQGWFYPQYATAHPSVEPRLLRAASRLLPFKYQDRLYSLFRELYRPAVLEGLIRAERALAQIDGLVIPFRELMKAEESLYGALETLYPGAPLERTHYVTPAFAQKRERIARRGETAYYRMLQRELMVARDRMGRGHSI